MNVGKLKELIKDYSDLTEIAVWDGEQFSDKVNLILLGNVQDPDGRRLADVILLAPPNAKINVLGDDD